MVLLVGFLFFAGAAQAQTTIAVDINRAVFTWQPSVGGSPVTDYVVQCGPSTGVYQSGVTVPAPQTTFSVASVVPSPGTYFCVVVARNQFGMSGPSNEVTFQAGSPPGPPSGLTIRAQ